MTQVNNANPLVKRYLKTHVKEDTLPKRFSNFNIQAYNMASLSNYSVTISKFFYSKSFMTSETRGGQWQ